MCTLNQNRYCTLISKDRSLLLICDNIIFYLSTINSHEACVLFSNLRTAKVGVMCEAEMSSVSRQGLYADNYS